MNRISIPEQSNSSLQPCRFEPVAVTCHWAVNGLRIECTSSRN